MAEQLNDMTVRETADFLRVSEKTVYRWIRQGVIPTFKFQGQYRFDRQEIGAWARYKRIGGGAIAAHPQASEESADVLEAIGRGGIHYKIEGAAPQEIFRHVVSFFPFGGSTPQEMKDVLINDMIERETLAPTGIGDGIALPHPRHPRDWGLGGPLVAIFFLERPVDLGAVDGEPVSVLIAILCATVRGHLRMLSQVSHLLNDPEMRAYLRTHPTRTDLTGRIADGLKGAGRAAGA